MLRSIKKQFEDLANKLENVDLFTVVAMLTSLVLLINSHGKAYALLAIGALLAMTFVPRLRRHPLFWVAMVFIWIPRLVFDWRQNEDHVFFGIYWCMAIGLALWGEQPAKVLRFNARILIGLSFTIATVWKIISPQFYEGELFHYKLLQDSRFRMMVTTTVGGLEPSDDESNAKAIKTLKAGVSESGVASLAYPSRVSLIAYAMTYWTILIEAALGIMFLLGPSILLGPSRIVNSIRNGLLMLFAITTYTIVPVLGFGVLFMTMGFANCENNEGRTKLCYLLTTLFLVGTFAVRIAVLQMFA